MTSYEYLKRFYRQYKVTPIMIRRSLGTALSVIDHLEHVEFQDLTFAVFAVCADRKDYESLIRPFESQMELAKIKPETFVDHLHDFYQSIAATIKKTDSCATFFEILAFVYDHVFCIPIKDRDEANFHIYCAYMDLLIQAVEYLHPNQNDIHEQIVGIQTDGTLICKEEPLKYLDVAMYEIERRIFAKKPFDLQALFQRTYRKYGYSDIKGEMDFQSYNMVLRNYDNNISLMVPWINEYTYDLLPERLADLSFKLPEFKNSFGIEKERFQRRRRTLSTNGLTVRIEESPIIEEMKLKEIYHADAIYLIGRVRLKNGDYLVRFNTQTGLFIDTFLDALNQEGKKMHYLLESVCLWAYGKTVLDDIDEWETYFDGRVAERQAIGGKLRNNLNRNNLESEDRTINGYVRKLPVGQKASAEAQMRAEMLGFALDEGETYVQSFIRSTWVVKSK